MIKGEREKKNVSALHIPCWLRQLIQWANVWCSENFLQRHFGTLFWVVLPGDTITLLGLQAYVGMSSNVRWTVGTLFQEKGLLSYWTYFLCFLAHISKLNWGRLIHLPHIVLLSKKNTKKQLYRIIHNKNRQKKKNLGDWSDRVFGKWNYFYVVLYSIQGCVCGVPLHDLCCLFICLWRLNSSLLVLLFLLCL